jgi:hypothetical protein
MALYRGPGGIGSGSITTTPIQVSEGGTGATSASDARTNLGLGSIATQNTNSIAITGGSIAGITDLAIADGGTGASTAQAARNNLLPTQTSESGKYLKTDGTNASWDQIDISSGDVTGTLPVASGGTGATSAANARTNLLPSYSGNGSRVLALNSGATDVEWIVNATGTVTSVGLTVPTGLAVTGSPVTSSGNIDIAFDTGYSIPTDTAQGNWDDAYDFVNAFPDQTGNSGKYLTTDGSVLSWVTIAAGGTVTSVDATVPTGFTVSGNPITSSGTLAFAFDTGYSLPTTASQGNWDTAYGWGDHASAGYLDSADIGVTVQGYDADTAKYDDVTANFSGTLQNGGNTVLTTASTIEGGTY